MTSFLIGEYVAVAGLVCLTLHLILAHCCLRITQRPALVLLLAGPLCAVTRQGQSSDTSSYSSRNSLVYSCKMWEPKEPLIAPSNDLIKSVPCFSINSSRSSTFGKKSLSSSRTKSSIASDSGSILDIVVSPTCLWCSTNHCAVICCLRGRG